MDWASAKKMGFNLLCQDARPGQPNPASPSSSPQLALLAVAPAAQRRLDRLLEIQVNSPSFFPFLPLLTVSAVASSEASGKVLPEKKKAFCRGRRRRTKTLFYNSLGVSFGIRARKRLQLSGALVDRWPELSGSSRFQHSRFTESVDLAQGSIV
ncbi:hypothetical protein M9H77_13103 [Catharanthus roseus]|uniref:Uncharacterized protein n=1 Tax=Catharanthus roseus TaxID=4058 RepID=A0ACC0BJ83_CATRO|nr:hypothetical protein M9H77_13103 [Catharanthus roseus]